MAIGCSACCLRQTLGSFVVIFLVSVAGSLVGFLYWNWKPARLFMGDSGSLFLGGTLAAASLVAMIAPGTDLYRFAALILLVLNVPLFDTSFVLVLRRLAGRKATRGGTDHVSHRLVSLGFSERGAVEILYLLGLTGGLIALMIRREGLQPMLPVAVLFTVALVLMGVYLARVRAYDAEDFRALKRSSFAPFLKHLTFRWHAGQVLLDLVLIAVCYYTAFRIRFEGETFSTFRALSHRLAAHYRGLQAHRVVPVRTLRSLVGDLQPCRSLLGRARCGCRLDSVGPGRRVRLSVPRDSPAPFSSSTRCCCLPRSRQPARHSA